MLGPVCKVQVAQNLTLCNISMLQPIYAQVRDPNVNNDPYGVHMWTPGALPSDCAF